MYSKFNVILLRVSSFCWHFFWSWRAQRFIAL